MTDEQKELRPARASAGAAAMPDRAREEIAAPYLDTINRDESHVPVWLVWSLAAKTGHTVLSAVCLTPAIAARYKTMLDNEPPMEGGRRWLRVYVEPSLANHLYGGLIDSQAIENAIRFVRRRDGD